MEVPAGECMICSASQSMTFSLSVPCCRQRAPKVPDSICSFLRRSLPLLHSSPFCLTLLLRLPSNTSTLLSTSTSSLRIWRSILSVFLTTSHFRLPFIFLSTLVVHLTLNPGRPSGGMVPNSPICPRLLLCLGPSMGLSVLYFVHVHSGFARSLVFSVFHLCWNRVCQAHRTRSAFLPSPVNVRVTLWVGAWRRCSTSDNSTSASWPKSNWPKSKLAEVDRARVWRAPIPPCSGTHPVLALLSIDFLGACCRCVAIGCEQVPFAQSQFWTALTPHHPCIRRSALLQSRQGGHLCSDAQEVVTLQRRVNDCSLALRHSH